MSNTTTARSIRCEIVFFSYSSQFEARRSPTRIPFIYVYWQLNCCCCCAATISPVFTFYVFFLYLFFFSPVVWSFSGLIHINRIRSSIRWYKQNLYLLDPLFVSFRAVFFNCKTFFCTRLIQFTYVKLVDLMEFNGISISAERFYCTHSLIY